MTDSTCPQCGKRSLTYHFIGVCYHCVKPLDQERWEADDLDPRSTVAAECWRWGKACCDLPDPEWLGWVLLVPCTKERENSNPTR